MADGDDYSAVGPIGVQRLTEALEDIAFPPVLLVSGREVRQDSKAIARAALVDVYRTEEPDAEPNVYLSRNEAFALKQLVKRSSGPIHPALDNDEVYGKLNMLWASLPRERGA